MPEWRKSTHSGLQNCVEAAAAWRKSTHSGAGNCVEIATAGSVLVRDSKDPAGPVLAFPREAWAEFIAGIKNGGS